MSTKVKYKVNRFAKLSVNPNFDPNLMLNINNKTKIESGISIGQFAGGSGNPGKLPLNEGLSVLRNLARNLIPHAQILKKVRSDKDYFDGLFLETAEGIYEAEEGETVTPGGYLDLRSKGRLVVYELLDLKGIINLDKTFELADYIAKNFKYDKVILDYDTYDPSGQLNAQVVVITPNIAPDYTANYKMEVETVFNGKVQESGLFVEILPEELPAADEIIREEITEELIKLDGDDLL